MNKIVHQTARLSYLSKPLKLTIDILILFSIFWSVELFFHLNFLETKYLFIGLLIIVGYFTGIYAPAYKYFNLGDLLKLLVITFFIFTLSYAVWFRFIVNESLTLNLFFIISSGLIVPRLFYRITFKNPSLNNKSNALIFGAGENGIFFKRAYQNSLDFQIKGFLDDNPSKGNQTIDGVPVLIFSEKLIPKLKSKGITHIIFSTDNITIKRKNFLLNLFTNNGFVVLRLPTQDEIINKNISQTKVLNFKVDELLSRDEIDINPENFGEFVEGKSVLVTGGCGSIGSEIVNQLSSFKNCKITVVDNSEIGIFNAIKKYQENNQLRFILLDITNKKLLTKLFQSSKFDIVYNAAAYKHVPIFEDNPFSGFKNNVLGCKNLIDLSLEFNIKKYILVSTDKAVNPTNLMGASKRVCEILCHQASFISETVFLATRFGNVLDSSGSVVPTFKSQIINGGPVTITDFNIERYFMTIPEASKLVLEASRIGEDSRIYVFDMGKPVKIFDLAKKMILLAGKTEEEIKIKEIGLRKGEKLYEELFLNEEVIGKSEENKNLLIGKKVELTKSQSHALNQLLKVLSEDKIKSFETFDIKSIVVEYSPKQNA